MATTEKFYLVCLTMDAINIFSESSIIDYLWDDRYIYCTKFLPAIPFSSMTAVPNEASGGLRLKEILIPNHFVAWVLAHPDKKVLGFEKPTQLS